MTLHPSLRLAALALLPLALVASCRTEVINIPVGGDGVDFVVRGVIGRSGGSLSVDDQANPVRGTEISVPAGAVSEETEIAVGPAEAAPAPPFGSRSLGPVVQIDFVDLQTPATVRLPFHLDPGAAEQVAVLRARTSTGLSTRGTGDAAGDTEWEPLEVEQVPGQRFVRLPSDRFGFFVVVAVARTVDGDGGVIPSDGAAGPDAAGPLDRSPPAFAGLDEVVLDPGQTSVTLSWPEAEDDQTPAGELRYRIYLPSFGTIGVRQGETLPGAVSATLPVAAGIRYYFLVRAVDAAGNEDSNLQVRSVQVPAAGADGGPDGPDLLANGQTCRQGDQCQSGRCTLGLCCDAACDGPCESCALAGQEGTCSNRPAGETGACGRDGLRQNVCDDQGGCNGCRHVYGTEVCNNGIDDNGDGLVDGEDLDCGVCGELPARRFCAAEYPARLFAADNGVSAAVASVATVGTEIGLGLNVGFPPLGYLRTVDVQTDQTATLVDTQGQFVADTTNQRPHPALLNAGGRFAFAYTANVDFATPEEPALSLFSADDAFDQTLLVDAPPAVESADFPSVAYDGEQVAYVYRAHNFGSGQHRFISPVSLTGGVNAAFDLQPSVVNGLGRPRLLYQPARSRWLVVHVSGGQVQVAAVPRGATSTAEVTLRTLTSEANGVSTESLAAVVRGGEDLLIAYVREFGTEVATAQFNADLDPVSGPTAVAPGTQMFVDNGSLSLAAGYEADLGAVLAWAADGQARVSRLDSTGAEFSTLVLGAQSGSAAGGVAHTGGQSFATVFNTFISRLGRDAPMMATLCPALQTPSNDTCATAIPVVFDAGNTATYLGTTFSAGDEAFGGCTLTGKSVYYAVQVPTSMTVSVTVTPTLGGLVGVSLGQGVGTCASASCFESVSRVPGEDAGVAPFSLAPGLHYVAVRAGDSGGDFLVRFSLFNPS